MHVWFGRYSRTDLHTCDNKTAVVAVVVTFIILVISKTPSKHQKPNSSASEVSSIFIATEVCIKNQSQYTSINPSIHPFAFPPVHSSIHVFLHHIQGSVDSSLLSRAVLTQVFFPRGFSGVTQVDPGCSSAWIRRACFRNSSVQIKLVRNTPGPRSELGTTKSNIWTLLE